MWVCVVDLVGITSVLWCLVACCSVAVFTCYWLGVGLLLICFMLRGTYFLEFVGIVYLQWLGFLADCFVVLFGLVLRLRALDCFLVWCLMLIWCFGFIACAPV